jgi:hypothetical protein
MRPPFYTQLCYKSDSSCRAKHEVFQLPLNIRLHELISTALRNFVLENAGLYTPADKEKIFRGTCSPGLRISLRAEAADSSEMSVGLSLHQITWRYVFGYLVIWS